VRDANGQALSYVYYAPADAASYFAQLLPPLAMHCLLSAPFLFLSKEGPVSGYFSWHLARTSALPAAVAVNGQTAKVTNANMAKDSNNLMAAPSILVTT
jgi:hypothetical protein